MNPRKLQALRNLAERPGTEAEGAVARAMLAKAEAQRSPEDQFLDKFRDFLRTGSRDDLAKAVGDKLCDCGTRYAAFTICENFAFHARINRELREKFPVGARVYYNRWAYAVNCPAMVAGYSTEWHGIWLRFEHLKNRRNVPVYSAAGWHLSRHPVDAETIRQAGLRGGWEKFERTPFCETFAE